jgi:L-ribulose-5-phosphate 3-epimerase
MKLPYTINTYSYIMSHTAEACLGELAEAGFTQFELMMYPGHAWPAEWDGRRRREFRSFLDRHGLRVVTLNQPNIDINLAGATPEMRRYSIDIVRSILQLAGDLGVPGVVVGPGKEKPQMRPPPPRQIELLHRALDQLVPAAKSAGTQILMENMPFAFLPDANGLLDAVESYGDPDIGILYDIANAAFIKEDISAALRRVRARLKLVHLSDTGTEIYKHDPIGLGTIDFAEVRRHLASIGWTDWPCLEIISPSDQPTAALIDSVRKLQALGWGDGRAGA